VHSTSFPSLVRVSCRSDETCDFTLIETMVVAGILVIVAALACPTYLNQIRKTRRADASLLVGAQILERFLTRVNAYNADGCPDPAGSVPLDRLLATASRSKCVISNRKDSPAYVTYRTLRTMIQTYESL